MNTIIACCIILLKSVIEAIKVTIWERKLLWFSIAKEGFSLLKYANGPEYHDKLIFHFVKESANLNFHW